MFGEFINFNKLILVKIINILFRVIWYIEKTHNYYSDNSAKNKRYANN